MSQPYWPINHNAKQLCHSDDMCSGSPNFLGDQVVAKCGNVFTSYGLDPIEIDKTESLEIIMYDRFNFNNIIDSI